MCRSECRGACGGGGAPIVECGDELRCSSTPNGPLDEYQVWCNCCCPPDCRPENGCYCLIRG
jgi:hypothetical protein